MSKGPNFINYPSDVQLLEKAIRHGRVGATVLAAPENTVFGATFFRDSTASGADAGFREIA
jgi:hypothetical protein